MQPIPETLEAIDELDPGLDDGTLLDQLTRMADRAREVVPELVGMSLASHEHGVTFTLVASDEEIAVLDAVQYLADGPCVQACATRRGIVTSAEDLLNERVWHLFGLATAAHGVRSTVTFPVLRSDRIIGTVNLYAGTPDAFRDTHEQLAAVLGAWAPGAVANADLSFSTRQVAEEAPEVLRSQALVDTASGIVAAERGVTVEAAVALLVDASRRAGIPLPAIARTIVRLHEGD